MPFTPEQTDTILRTLRMHLPGNRITCPLSNDDNWQMHDLGVLLSLSDNFKAATLGGPALPLAALTCSTCGYTLLVNLISLGLAGLFDIPAAE